MLLNLIRNSAEAFAAAGQGHVVTLVARLDECYVRLRVSDDGPGIHAPEALFQPFRTSKPDGMGLGLCYCKRAIESYGGTLHGGNLPVGGAYFDVSLPGVVLE